MRRHLALVFLFVLAASPSAAMDASQVPELVHKALDEHDASAAYALGQYAEQAGPVPVYALAGANYIDAWAWYVTAAEAGSRDAVLRLKQQATAHTLGAMVALGDLYMSGKSALIERDEFEGARFYVNAATLGSALANFKVGMLQMRGDALPLDRNDACDHFLKAAKGGIDEAYRPVVGCVTQMPPDYQDDALSTVKNAARTDPLAKLAEAEMIWRGIGGEADYKSALETMTAIFDMRDIRGGDETRGWAARGISRLYASQGDTNAEFRFLRFAIAFGDSGAKDEFIQRGIALGIERPELVDLIRSQDLSEDEQRARDLWIDIRTFSLRPQQCGRQPNETDIQKYGQIIISSWQACLQNDARTTAAAWQALQEKISAYTGNAPDAMVEDTRALAKSVNDRISADVAGLKSIAAGDDD